MKIYELDEWRALVSPDRDNGWVYNSHQERFYPVRGGWLRAEPSLSKQDLLAKYIGSQHEAIVYAFILAK